MKLDIPTDSVQSWQIDGWLEQGYFIISFVKGFVGIIYDVKPGHIIIDIGMGRTIDVDCIPTKVAQLDGVYIVLGEYERD